MCMMYMLCALPSPCFYPFHHSYNISSLMICHLLVGLCGQIKSTGYTLFQYITYCKYDANYETHNTMTFFN